MPCDTNLPPVILFWSYRRPACRRTWCRIMLKQQQLLHATRKPRPGSCSSTYKSHPICTHLIDRFGTTKSAAASYRGSPAIHICRRLCSYLVVEVRNICLRIASVIHHSRHAIKQWRNKMEPVRASVGSILATRHAWSLVSLASDVTRVSLVARCIRVKIRKLAIWVTGG